MRRAGWIRDWDFYRNNNGRHAFACQLMGVALRVEETETGEWRYFTNGTYRGTRYTESHARAAVRSLAVHAFTPSARRSSGAQAPVTVGYNLGSRTFGVEIEVSRSSDHIQALTALRAAGVDVVNEYRSYSHRTPQQWALRPDATCGFELVSPVLSGEAGIAEVKRVMATMRASCNIDNNCGLHVHVGARDLRSEQLYAICTSYSNGVNHLEAMVAPTRRGNSNNYCRPIRQASGLNDLNGWNREVTEANKRRALTEQISYGTRYRTVNLHSFARHGTVEFRQHQGTLNGDKAEHWIRLVMRLVQIAASERLGKVVETKPTLTEWLESLELPRTTTVYLRARAITFATRSSSPSGATIGDFAAAVRTGEIS